MIHTMSQAKLDVYYWLSTHYIISNIIITVLCIRVVIYLVLETACELGMISVIPTLQVRRLRLRGVP